MEIERVNYNENFDKYGRKINKKQNKNLDYLLYFAIAGLILPFGIILSIYVLFKIGKNQVIGNVKIAKYLSWFQIIFSIIMILIMFVFFPNFKFF